MESRNTKTKKREKHKKLILTLSALCFFAALLQMNNVVSGSNRLNDTNVLINAPELTRRTDKIGINPNLKRQAVKQNSRLALASVGVSTPNSKSNKKQQKQQSNRKNSPEPDLLTKQERLDLQLQQLELKRLELEYKSGQIRQRLLVKNFK